MAGIDVEPYLEVSADVATQSVGFAVDVGGSATKLVYRSKQDYRDRVPINPIIPDGKGILRMVALATNDIDVDNLMKFLERECDISKDKRHKTAYCTGLYTALLQEKVMETFGLKINSFMEYDYMLDGLRHVSENCKLMDVIHAEETKGIEDGNRLHECNKMASGMQAAGMCRGGMYAHSDEWKTTDDSKQITELSPPFILTQIGSTVSHHKVENDWSYDLLEFSQYGGKSFLSVCGLISGKREPFDKIIDQATAGNTRNVDILSGDTRAGSSEDIYSEVDKELPFFLFGKLANQPPETFSKEDLLASWTHATCLVHATYSQLVALAHGIDKVVMIGGFCNNALVRQNITKFWYSRLLMVKGKKIGLYFLKNGQFLTALGAYMRSNKYTEDP